MVYGHVTCDVAALKIHMSHTAHDALAAFPEFITEPRGEILVKVDHSLTHSPASTALVSMGHETGPKIIINDTINLFLKVLSAFW